MEWANCSETIRLEVWSYRIGWYDYDWMVRPLVMREYNRLKALPGRSSGTGTVGFGRAVNRLVNKFRRIV